MEDSERLENLILDEHQLNKEIALLQIRRAGVQAGIEDEVRALISEGRAVTICGQTIVFAKPEESYVAMLQELGEE